ncbi:MAG: GIY-YIG nuclease family protein [Alphaproteobacteria bacterium]|nr:GIY-YIG nuclease family protein [Alphaproteobacteria bacterium]
MPKLRHYQPRSWPPRARPWGQCCGGNVEEKRLAVYILASRKFVALYVGVTSALWNRVAVHKQAEVAGFTKDYHVHRLVWYEHHHAMENAIKREKQLKKWNRAWKIRIIEELNPDWRDLYEEIDYDGTLVDFV